jgi:hypothetical protein
MPVGDVGVDDVEGLERAIEQARDRVGDRPVLPGCVVEHGGGYRLRAAVERGEERVEFANGELAAEPAEAGDEDELQLGDHRPLDVEEQVVEAAVLEVVLDAGAADPADAPVDDQHLAVVDVPDRPKVPPRRVAAAERPERSLELRGAHDADLDACSGQALVERR